MQTQIEGATNGSVADILLEGVVGESAPTEPLLSAETPDEQVPALTPDNKPEEVEGATPAAKPDKQPAYREAQLPDGTTIKIKNHWTTNWMPYRLRKETDKATAKFVSLLRRYQDKSWLDAEGKIDYGRVPWPIVLEMGYGNLGKSTQKNMSDMWDMVMHPVQTIDMLKDLASQTASKGFESWLRAMEPEKTEGWKGFDTPMFDMLIEVYKQNYDLEDNQSGLKQYIINEPASFLEDIATVSTLFLAGTGFATKGIQSTGSALRLTQPAKNLLKFNTYYNSQFGRTAVEAMDYLRKHTPEWIATYGKHAYFIGTGSADGGYAPGFWAKLAHHTLNYMDVTGAPFIAATGAFSGSINYLGNPGKKLSISQDEFTDITRKLFERYHPELKDKGITVDQFDEFIAEASILYAKDKTPSLIYDESMAEYRKKLLRFQELENHMAESGIMDRRLAERGDLRNLSNLNLSDMIIDNHPASDILKNFDSYQSGTEFGDKFGNLSEIVMSTYYRHTAKFLDELDDPFESLKIRAPTSNNMDMDNKIRLGRLIRDIEKTHDISKTANQHLEGLEESIATQMREVALKHQADPSQGADAIRALLLQRQHFYNLANDSLPENAQQISIIQILYHIEALESLLRSNAMIEMDVMMEGHNLLNALYLDYFENIENAFKPTYKHEDSLYKVFLEFRPKDYTPPANSPLTTANVFESNYLMRDEYAINEAIQRWNQGMDIDEFIDYVQNESSSAWLQKFESELEDNLHLSEDLEKLQSMKDEVSEITKNSVEAKELINSTTKLTDATIENTLVNAINKLDLYQFKPFHRQFIDYLFFDDNTDRITRIMNRIKPQNRGSLQRDIFYELLNRSRKWDGKYLRTANRNEVPFWKHSQDYELGHFVNDIAKSHEFGDTSIEFMDGGKLGDFDFNNHVARFDNRLLRLWMDKYLPEDIIDRVLDLSPSIQGLKTR